MTNIFIKQCTESVIIGRRERNNACRDAAARHYRRLSSTPNAVEHSGHRATSWMAARLPKKCKISLLIGVIGAGRQASEQSFSQA